MCIPKIQAESANNFWQSSHLAPESRAVVEVSDIIAGLFELVPPLLELVLGLTLPSEAGRTRGRSSA